MVPGMPPGVPRGVHGLIKLCGFSRKRKREEKARK